jgi:hypothetical protein
VQHFLEKYGEESRKPQLYVSPAAMDRLMAYDWRGNVRELENVIERAVVLSSEREIGVDLIPDSVGANPMLDVPDVVIPAEGIQFREVIIGHERRYIEAALDAAGGVQKKAAELLHIKPTTLNEMIQAVRDRSRAARRRRRRRAGRTRRTVVVGSRASASVSSPCRVRDHVRAADRRRDEGDPDDVPDRDRRAAIATSPIAIAVPLFSSLHRLRPIDGESGMVPRSRANSRSYFARIVLQR